jgi:hypothetical protein
MSITFQFRNTKITIDLTPAVATSLLLLAMTAWSVPMA